MSILGLNKNINCVKLAISKKEFKNREKEKTRMKLLVLDQNQNCKNNIDLDTGIEIVNICVLIG